MNTRYFLLLIIPTSSAKKKKEEIILISSNKGVSKIHSEKNEKKCKSLHDSH